MATTTRKRLKKAQRICLVLEAEHFEYIKQVSVNLTTKEGRLVTPTEVLRSAIEHCYPNPMNTDPISQSSDLEKCKVG